MTAPRHVLIVEDEWIIAEMLQDVLETAGFVVRGPVGTTADATRIIAQGGLHAALLDVSLRGETSFAIARMLAANSVPFLFMTGYVGTDLPQEFRDRPMLNKPVEDHRLLQWIQKSFAGAA